jgi:hypothetical protein
MYLSTSWTFHVQFGNPLYVYQLYFHIANLLDVSLSFFYESGSDRRKSMYETVLSLIRSFKGQRCGNSHFILSQNDKNLKDSPITLTSFSMSFDFSSLNSVPSSASLFMHLVVSFSCTSVCLFSFCAYCFCFPYILHPHACVDCENEVSSFVMFRQWM